MSRKPLALSDFNVALRKHVDPGSPTPMRMMAAKGLVPMAPEEMALVFYQLSLDADATVAKAATEALKGTPDDILVTATSADLPGSVLDWCASITSDRNTVLHEIALNPAAEPETIGKIASKGTTDLCDLIAENQVRLLDHPKIIEALYMNPRARMSTVDKLIDLARRHNIALDGLPSLRPLLESKEPIFSEAPDDETEALEDDELFAQFLFEGLEQDEDDGGEEKNLLSLLEGTTSAEGDDDAAAQKNRAFFLGKLSVSGKIRVATLGTAADRNLLVRDTNRLVHMAAVASPKNTDHEAIDWSGNRSMPEGVISFIAQQREWVRHYQVKLNLVNNPKLPLQKSIRFLNFLQPKDLRQLSRNRNVPGTLARQAKVLVDKRSGGRQDGKH